MTEHHQQKPPGNSVSSSSELRRVYCAQARLVFRGLCQGADPGCGHPEGESVVLTHTDQLFAVPEVTGEGTGLLDMAMLT